MKTPVEALLGVVGIRGSLRIVSGELRMACQPMLRPN